MDLSFEFVLFALLLFWALLFAARLRPSFIHLMAVVLSLNLVGLYMLGVQSTSFGPMYIFEVGLLTFAIGVLGGRFVHTRQHKQTIAEMNVSDIRQHNAFLVSLIVGIPVLVLGTMLFALSGIPLLSENVNEYRFTITEGTGLFWRMQQSGIPMLTLITGVYLWSSKRPLGRMKALFFLFFAATLVTSVVRGHKAGILTGLLWIVVLFLVMNRSKRMPGRWIAVLLILLACSCGIVVAVTQYSLGLNTEQAIAFLVDRLTVGAARGFYQVVEHYVPMRGLEYGLAQWPSVLGFLAIFRILPHGAGQEELGLSVSQSIHIATYGVPQTDSFVIFPLAITPFGDFYADFGVLGVGVGGVLLGLLAEWLYRHAMNAPPSAWKAVLIALQVEMVLYASRGSLLGRVTNEVINWLFVVAAYCFLYWALRNFARSISSPAQTHYSLPQQPKRTRSIVNKSFAFTPRGKR